MTVGERIRNARNKIGLSQVDFADKINVSKQTLYKYENNLITNIPADKIEAIAKLTTTPPAYLMGWCLDNGDDVIDYYDNNIEKISQIFEKEGYSVHYVNYSYNPLVIYENISKNLVFAFYEGNLLSTYEHLKINFPNQDITVQNIINEISKNFEHLLEIDLNFIKRYRSLDPHGKDMVDTVLDKENKRIEQYGKLDDRNVVILAEYEASKAPTHIIPYWEYGVSAGNGIYQLNDTSSVMMTLWATEITKQADFIIKVSGASMEPDYHDGDKVLVDRKTVVEKGEVGIFVKNGDTYIKELGENELISRNPEFPNIPVKDFDNVVCLGKVIGILTDSLIAEE